jgi:hypothetical protein
MPPRNRPRVASNDLDTPRIRVASIRGATKKSAPAIDAGALCSVVPGLFRSV